MQPPLGRVMTPSCLFLPGVKQGKSEDELVAEQFGAKDPETLSDTQKAYVDKVKENLAKVSRRLHTDMSNSPLVRNMLPI